jgi:hypothetical protein
MKASARCGVVALMICAWVAISNHCVFAAIGTKPASTQSECPFHSKPAKPQQPPAGTQCCKILRAIATSHAKIAPGAIVDLAHVDFARLIVSAPPKISFFVVTLDTGPPGTTSFAELIGSMRAHAPPFRA